MSVFGKVFSRPGSSHSTFGRSMDAFPPDAPAPDRSVSRRTPRPKIDLDTDITEGKHGGDLASSLAHDKIKHVKKEMHQQLIEIFKAMGDLTSKEICEIVRGRKDMDKNSTSPRLSEMKALGMLEETGQMRDGCHVLRLRR